MSALRLLAALLAFLWPLQALAGAGTIAVKDQTGGTQAFAVVTNLAGAFIQQSAVCDGAAAAQCAAVKAASTAAVAADPALVVAISPNNTVAATQSGTWNFNNISGTVSLPTGAATAAKQPALGTAGNASSDVVSVQGIASMTALKVDGSGVTQPISGTITANAGANLNTSALALDTSINGILLSQGSATSGQKGPLLQGAVTTNAPSYTTAQTSPLSLDPSGLLRLSLKDTPSNANNFNVNLAASAATVAVNNTQQGTASQNVAQFGGTNIVTGTGAGGSGIPRVTISNDSSLAANQSVNVAQINGTAPAQKASGTNAATTDTSLVVAPSPNPSTVCPSLKPISQTASTDLITSTNKLHICGILIVSATAQSVSLVEGTGSACGTGTAAVMGATTAANGMALAANGGFSHTADRPFMVTQTTADHLCLLQSGAGNVSGFISYIDHN